jgi:hypothetical protein
MHEAKTRSIPCDVWVFVLEVECNSEEADAMGEGVKE